MLSSRHLPGVFHQAVLEHLSVVSQLDSQYDALERAAAHMSQAILAGRKIFWCGNGGSAADAQHLAAELVGRFKRERGGLASIALTADSSVLTAIANDYGYDEIFGRQLEALCQRDDILVGMSTSGNSANVCYAMQRARDIGAFTIAMTGGSGGRLASLADVCICARSSDAARIQEAHILCGHMLCDRIEEAASEEMEAIAAGGAR